MKRVEANQVGQAVFGYSNGHRLLSATLQLSTVDIYELAAASDLAPGARISGDASYLTGLYLPESKQYALIRTWLAPEMSRPGCVWSHVLLLDHTVLATQVDLAVIADLHRRPAEYAADPSFSIPIKINRRLRGSKASRSLTEKALLACYDNYLFEETLKDDYALEQAILAVWSQQWPRLRRHFVFRTVPTTTSLRGQFFQFKRGGHSVDATLADQWLEEAVTDAVSKKVTPLRQFLWRYGKDIQPQKNTLPKLVEIYTTTRSSFLPYEMATTVLTSFPPDQADTLKKDVLGLSLDKSARLPRLKGADIVRFIAENEDTGVSFSNANLSNVFSVEDEAGLREVSRALMEYRDQLDYVFCLLIDSVMPFLSNTIIEHDDTPIDFAILAIEHDAKLLTTQAMHRFTNDQLEHLYSSHLTDEQRREVIIVILQRPSTNHLHSVVFSDPERAFADAIALHISAKLHPDWIAHLRSAAHFLLHAIQQIKGGEELNAAVHLIGFPPDSPSIVQPFFVAFQNNRSSLSHDDETSVMSYLLALCISTGIENHVNILAEIIEDLRARIINGSLPTNAERLLSEYLPKVDSQWDLNRRLLKLFRKSSRDNERIKSVVNLMTLSDEEYAYATDQDPKNVVRSYINLFNPWFYLG